MPSSRNKSAPHRKASNSSNGRADEGDSRGISTPRFFVLLGPDYAGKSSVLAELRRSAVRWRLVSIAGGLELRNVAARVDTTDGTGRYVFAASPAVTPWHEDETVAFSARLDDELARESPGYRAARIAGRLAAPTTLRLPADAFLRDWQDTVAAGVRPTQVKDRLFRQDPGQWERLVGRDGAAPGPLPQKERP